MSTIDAELLEETENDRIATWRMEELLRAGYRPDHARKLALRQDVDLHRAVDLLKAGCSAELALAILL